MGGVPPRLPQLTHTHAHAHAPCRVGDSMAEQMALSLKWLLGQQSPTQGITLITCPGGYNFTVTFRRNNLLLPTPIRHCDATPDQREAVRVARQGVSQEGDRGRRLTLILTLTLTLPLTLTLTLTLLPLTSTPTLTLTLPLTLTPTPDPRRVSCRGPCWGPELGRLPYWGRP